MTTLQIAPLVQAFQELWNEFFESRRRTNATLDEAQNLNLESKLQRQSSRAYQIAIKSSSINESAI